VAAIIALGNLHVIWFVTRLTPLPENRRSVNPQMIPRRRAGLVRPANELSETRCPRCESVVGNSLCLGKEKHTMGDLRGPNCNFRFKPRKPK
jgi:hypothetical protein